MTALTHDGVRLLRAHRPGRTAAGLVFRVGYADETLATSGLTGLVVAIALRAVERPGLDVSASVGPAVTEIGVTGTAERVATTLRDLSRALADLPVRHRESEARALWERGGGGSSVPAWRFGAQGYGLGTYRLGLHTVGDDDLRAWARERFTGSNAVAWVTGEDVPELALPLPPGRVDGKLMPAPPVPDSIVPLPADAPVGGTEVAWDAVVPDTPAAQVLAEVARRAVFQGVRQDHGWTYAVSAGVGMLDGVRANVRIAAGLREETAAAATGELLDTLGRLRFAATDTEVASARAHLLAAFDEPHQEAMWLPEDAALTVLGLAVPTPAERRAALAAVTPGDVVGVARQAWETALLVAPVGQGWAGTKVVRRGAGDPVQGKVFQRLDADVDVVVGDGGVTLRRDRTTTTVLFDEAAAVLAFPDGGRILVGRDGAQVRLEPVLHDDFGAGDVVRIMERVPPHLVVQMPERDAPERPGKEEIQQAGRARADREVEEDGILRSVVIGVGRPLMTLVGVVALVVLLIAAGLGTLFAAATTLAAVGPALRGEGPWSHAGLFGALGVVGAAVTWLAYRGIMRLPGATTD